jgi:hypothetical protein
MGPDSRRAFRPLYVVAIGFVVLALGALATYTEGITGQAILVDYYYAFYAAAAVEVIMLGIAAAMILSARRFYSIPVSTGLLSVLLFYLAGIYPQTSDFLMLIGVLLPSIVLAGIGGLFVWITRETRRGTSAALAFALIAQIAGLPVLYFQLLVGPNAFLALFLALMGPAVVVFTFVRPDQKITFELVGYGAAFAAPVLILAAVQSAGLATDLILLAIASTGAMAILLAIGTASYLYGRWTETKQIPTFLYMIAFLMFATGQMMGMLENLGMFPGQIGIYAELLLTGFALTLLSVGAIYAADWKGAALVPMLVYLPIALLIAQEFPSSISGAFMNLIYLAAPLIGLMLLPSILFLGAWRRMRNKGTPGRLRPLGVAIAILLFFLIRLPTIVIGIGGLDYSYGLVFLSFLMFWLAFTRRLDRIYGVRV